MKKNIVLLIMITSLLTACNANAKSSSVQMKVIDENLKLKEEIAELEDGIKGIEKRHSIEQEIEKQVIAFFYNIKVGNLKAAQMMTTEQIKVNKSGLHLSNNQVININGDKYFALQLVRTDWQDPETCCVTFTFLYDNKESKMDVSIIKEDGGWKINDLGTNLTT